MNIREEIINIKDSIINWRRDFHQYPELAFNEYRTGDVIAKELRTMGLDPKENVGKTGVTADLKCGDGPVIAIRADMDALPIEETSGLDFSSKNSDACPISFVFLYSNKWARVASRVLLRSKASFKF